MKIRKKNKKHVAILLPDLSGGGAERVSVNLANALVQRGYSVDMVLLSASGVFLPELSPDIDIVDLGVKRIRWLLPRLISYLRREKPAALLACMWPLTVIAIWARALARVHTRIVVAEHLAHSHSQLARNKLNGFKMRSTMHFFLPKADAIVAVSNGVADDLAKLARIDRNIIKVIYNPVVASSISVQAIPKTPEAWVVGPHKRVIAVGTLKSQKAYPLLLDAFTILRETVDARLLILGEGQCRSALELQASRLGIAPFMDMPGFISDPTPYFAHADLHVLSSTHEGLPTVMVEALAVGTPVVSTDCPAGPREILADGKYGRLVPVGDAKALALAMKESLKAVHDHETLKSRAKDFSIDRAVDLYIDILLPHEKSNLPVGNKQDSTHANSKNDH